MVNIKKNGTGSGFAPTTESFTRCTGKIFFRDRCVTDADLLRPPNKTNPAGLAGHTILLYLCMIMTHNQLQQKCWQLLWNEFPQSRYCAWHTKNEDIPHKGETKKDYIIRRSQDKAIGLLAGVWDIVFYWKGVLYIFDIKVGKDKLSEKQLRFEDCIIQQGGKSYEVNDREGFHQVLKQIFNVKDR